MRLDAHQHFWRYEPAGYGWISDDMPHLKRDFLPADLLPALQEQDFAGCVAVQARQSEEETLFLLDLAMHFPFVKAVVGWVDLCSPSLEERLVHFRSFSRLKGFRHIVQDEPDDRFLLRDDFVRGVRCLAQYGFTYDILVYEKHLPVVVEFLERCPDQPFVLDHIGKPAMREGLSARWQEGIRAIARYPNVYCKVSGLVTEADWNHWHPDDFLPFLEMALDAFGPQRLMIGSDWPVCLLAAPDYRSVVDIIDRFTISMTPQERAGIYGENARRFYKIE